MESENDREGAQVRDGCGMADLLGEGGYEEGHRGKTGPYQESARVAEEGHMDVVGMDGSVGADSHNGSEGEAGHGPEGIDDDTENDDADFRNAVVVAEADGQVDRLGIQLVARKGRELEVTVGAVRRNPPGGRMDGPVDEHHEAACSPGKEVRRMEEAQEVVLGRRCG